MKKALQFNRALNKLKSEIIGQIKVELLVNRKLDSGLFNLEDSGFIVTTEQGNEEVLQLKINWSDEEAKITLQMLIGHFELEEMNTDDLLLFYSLIQNKEFIVALY